MKKIILFIGLMTGIVFVNSQDAVNVPRVSSSAFIGLSSNDVYNIVIANGGGGGIVAAGTNGISIVTNGAVYTISLNSFRSAPLYVTNGVNIGTNSTLQIKTPSTNQWDLYSGTNVNPVLSGAATGAINVQGQLSAGGGFVGNLASATNGNATTLTSGTYAPGNALIINPITMKPEWIGSDTLVINDSMAGSIIGCYGALTSASGGGTTLSTIPSSVSPTVGSITNTYWLKLYSYPTNGASAGYYTYSSSVGTVSNQFYISTPGIVINATDWTNVLSRFGLFNNATTTAWTDAIGWFARQDWSVNWMTVVASNSINYYVTSTIPATNYIVPLSIWYTNNTDVNFGAYGTNVVTMTVTNFPTNRGIRGEIGSHGINSTGSANQQAMYVHGLTVWMR